MHQQSFVIPFYQTLQANGELSSECTSSLINNKELLIKFYRVMVLNRQFDQKAIALQRTGQMGTYPSTLGQEAISTAIGMAMDKTDVLVPYYRDVAAQYLRGVKLSDLLLYWGGHEQGSNYDNAKEDLPICVPISTQMCHACGVATAIKIRHQKRVVVATCGDGATSKGDFLEALNLAATWQLPVVFIINNNQWAISVPRSIQCAAKTLAQKAVGAGFEGEQVDGNDVIALHDRITNAIDHARQGKGPSLIEAITYRLCDHTTADDATRYRSAEELNQHWQDEPIKRLQTFLHQQGYWDAKQEQTLQTKCKDEIDKAVEDYLATETEPAESMFDHLYAYLPTSLERQREDVINKQREKGGQNA